MTVEKSGSSKSPSPHDCAREALPDDFLRRLGQEFGFDGDNPDFVAAIRRAAHGFYVARGLSDFPELRKKDRAKFVDLKRDAEKFQEILEAAKKSEIDDDLELLASTILGANSDKSDNSSLTAIRKISRKFDALVALVNILIKSTDFGIRTLSERRGPKTDDSLEIVVRRLGDFWISELGRKFTIDHHKGRGITKSFQFVQAIVRQLDENISETKIVTAMRADLAKRPKN